VPDVTSPPRSGAAVGEPIRGGRNVADAGEAVFEEITDGGGTPRRVGPCSLSFKTIGRCRVTMVGMRLVDHEPGAVGPRTVPDHLAHQPRTGPHPTEHVGIPAPEAP
jgi:hypothetical protein